MARGFRISLNTAHRWFHRAHGLRLDRVDWRDRPRGQSRRRNQTPPRVERRIVALRSWLQHHCALGECGGAAIRRRLQQEAVSPLPSVRTIERILGRRGLLFDHRRQRVTPPPPGWYLPDLAIGEVELDTLDFVEGLVLRGGNPVDVFTGISLYGSLAQAWPASAWSSAQVLTALIGHWRAEGLPHYAQFDNDTRFQGPHTAVGSLGRVVHLCLCLGVIPVFAPPRETGFHAKIESFNHLWQEKVWRRHHFRSLNEVRRHSSRFIAAHRLRHALRIDSAPRRRVSPAIPPVNFSAGKIVFLRRTDAAGSVTLLQQSLTVARTWSHRLVRCELDPLSGLVHLYALRRRQPNWQPLLTTRQIVVKIAPWHHHQVVNFPP